jgi:ABC-type nickel/cobalt efflux system permease component RcnA
MDKTDTIFLSVFMVAGGIALILAGIFKNKAILTILSIRSMFYWIGKKNNKEIEYKKIDQIILIFFGVILLVFGISIFLNNVLN